MILLHDGWEKGIYINIYIKNVSYYYCVTSLTRRCTYKSKYLNHLSEILYTVQCTYIPHTYGTHVDTNWAISHNFYRHRSMGIAYFLFLYRSTVYVCIEKYLLRMLYIVLLISPKGRTSIYSKYTRGDEALSSDFEQCLCCYIV